jgi:hypothetical protein
MAFCFLALADLPGIDFSRKLAAALVVFEHVVFHSGVGFCHFTVVNFRILSLSSLYPGVAKSFSLDLTYASFHSNGSVHVCHSMEFRWIS